LPQRIRVASVDDVPPGSAREVTAAGLIIALYNVDGQFHALDGICPHAGGPLGQGELNATTVTCPWHGWQFDVTTGKHCLTESIVQTSYPIEVEAGEIYVQLP